MSPEDLPHALLAFGPTPHPEAWSVRAGIRRQGASVSVCWLVAGAVEALPLPPLAARRSRRDGLWEHTCCEAFLAPVASPRYWELDVSPAGHWNFYRFDREREGMTTEPRLEGLAAFARARHGARGIAITVTLDLAPIPELSTAPLDVGLATVLAPTPGARSYWALRHVAAVPDFHRRESFLARI